jgi:hypothetical protein
MHLLGGDSTPEHRRAYIAISRLFLWMNAYVIPIDIGRGIFFNCRIKLKTNALLQFVEKSLRRPSMANE